jgi:DnaK suppressor protein
MHGYQVAEHPKLDHGKFGESGGMTISRAPSVVRGRGVQELRVRSTDKLNPFVPFGSPDATPVFREAAPGAPRLDSPRNLLLALRARLRGDINEETAFCGCGIASSCSSPDAADLANESIEQDLALSMLSSVNGTLDKIETALARIDEGSYGRCLDCGTRIPAARLEAIPYATHCVGCTARQERGV